MIVSAETASWHSAPPLSYNIRMPFYWFDFGVRNARSAAAQKEQSVPAPKNAYQQPAPKSLKPATNANQIMRSPVKTLTPETTFEEARAFFRQNRFRHVPIVNAEGKLVGLISDRDVLREAANINTGPEAWVKDLVQVTRTIADFMTKRVLTATPSAEIRQIAKAMFEERIGSMPIVNEEEKLVGIITRSDILRTLVHNAPLEIWI